MKYTRYPEFKYEGYTASPHELGCEVEFRYSASDKFSFETSYIFPFHLSKLNRFYLTLLGAIESLSYWKAFCSKELHLKLPTGVDPKSFEAVILNGMGEYFFQNHLPFTDPDFLQIHFDIEQAESNHPRLDDRLLLLASGGKDTALSANILKKNKIDCSYLLINSNKQTREMLTSISPETKQIFVTRSIDKQIITLNEQGFLNGHVPFSATLALAGLIVANALGFRWVAASNERSSNEGNVEYLGKVINHQYSKTYEFESILRTWTGPHYFSLLRPLYEIQIAALLARYPMPSFLSCNKGSNWCGKCPKCLSVFLMFSPFVPPKTLVEMFGRDLSQNSELVPLLQELTGLSESKPFECVGTYSETLAAIKLALPNQDQSAPLWKACVEIIKGSELDPRRLMASFSDQHFLPPQFEGLLREEFRLGC